MNFSGPDRLEYQMMRGIFAYLGINTPSLPGNTKNILKRNVTQMK